MKNIEYSLEQSWQANNLFKWLNNASGRNCKILGWRWHYLASGATGESYVER